MNFEQRKNDIPVPPDYERLPEDINTTGIPNPNRVALFVKGIRDKKYDIESLKESGVDENMIAAIKEQLILKSDIIE